MGGLPLKQQLLHQSSLHYLAVPGQIGRPLHHAVEYLKTSRALFRGMSEPLIIYVARKHPTALIKVLAAGAPIPRPAQHSLSVRRHTDGAAPCVHVHAERNMEPFR